jgi:DNA-binding CsgD family transcriptional regulator
MRPDDLDNSELMADSTELSERELEILRLVATGASNKEIAQRLFISANTVKVHLRNIFSKIEVTSRTEAAMYAVNNGLVETLIPSLEEVSDEAETTGGRELVEAADDLSPPQTPSNPLYYWAAIPRIRLAVFLGILLIVVLGSISIARGLMPEPTSQPSQPGLPIDASSPRWLTMASLPTARSGLGLAAYENQIYAIAGRDANGVTGIVELYEAETDSWSVLSSKPTPVGDINAGLIGGKIYVPGGMLASGVPTDVLEIYDPREDSWVAGASLPAAISGYGLVAYEGKLFLFGGFDGQNYLNSVYEYDPTQDIWLERMPMPERKAYFGAVVASGRIFLMGGYDGRRALRSNYLYSPEDEVRQKEPWKRLQDLPRGRYAMGIASVADIVYVIGGENEGEALPYLEYIIPTNSWATFEPLEDQAWSQGSLAILGTNLHVVGGIQAGTLTSQHLAYKAVYIINMPVIR